MAIQTYVPVVPYADLTFAEAYVDDQVPSRVASWFASGIGDTEKEAALKEATQWIDTLNLVGFKTDADQVREFPRNGEADIPMEVSMACVEVAIAILGGASLEKMLLSAGIASESIGDASRSYEAGGATKKLELYYGLPSALAARYIVGWLKDPEVINLNRVG